MNDDGHVGRLGVLVHEERSQDVADEAWPLRSRLPRFEEPRLPRSASAHDEIAQHRAVIDTIDRDLLPKVPTEAMKDLLAIVRGRFSARLDELLAIPRTNEL